MSSTRARKHEKLQQLHAASPNCARCGRATALLPSVHVKDAPEDRAVLHHKYSKHDPERAIPRRDQNFEERSLLYCKACSDEVGRERHLQVDLEDRRAAAGRRPGGKKPVVRESTPVAFFKPCTASAPPDDNRDDLANELRAAGLSCGTYTNTKACTVLCEGDAPEADRTVVAFVRTLDFAYVKNGWSNPEYPLCPGQVPTSPEERVLGVQSAPKAPHFLPTPEVALRQPDAITMLLRMAELEKDVASGKRTKHEFGTSPAAERCAEILAEMPPRDAVKARLWAKHLLDDYAHGLKLIDTLPHRVRRIQIRTTWLQSFEKRVQEYRAEDPESQGRYGFIQAFRSHVHSLLREGHRRSLRACGELVGAEP